MLTQHFSKKVIVLQKSIHCLKISTISTNAIPFQECFPSLKISQLFTEIYSTKLSYPSTNVLSRIQNPLKSLKLKLVLKRIGVQKHTHTSLNIQRCYLLKITLSLSCLSRFISKSGVQMVKEGHIRLPSLKKRICRAASRLNVNVNLLFAVVPVDRQKCLPGHVCLLLQVATGEGQLAVPMERRCGPNKRRREKENQLNLR